MIVLDIFNYNQDDNLGAHIFCYVQAINNLNLE